MSVVETGLSIVGSSAGMDVLGQMAKDAKATVAGIGSVNDALRSMLDEQKAAASAAAAARAADVAARKASQDVAEAKRAEAAAAKEVKDAERAAASANRESARDWKKDIKDVGRVLLQLGKIGVEAFVSTARAAYESRAATDPMRKSMDGFALAAQKTQIALGDALLPTLAGFSDALKPLLKDLTKWLDANRDLISTKVTDFMVTAARVAVGVLAPGVKVLAGVWYGLKIAVTTVSLVVEKSFGMMLSGAAKVAQGLSGLAKFAGADEFAATLAGIQTSAEKWGDTFSAAGDKAANSIQADAMAMYSLNNTINDVEKKIDKALGHVAVDAANNLHKAIVRIGGIRLQLGLENIIERGQEAARAFGTAWGGAMSTVTGKAMEWHAALKAGGDEGAALNMSRAFLANAAALDLQASSMERNAIETQNAHDAWVGLRTQWGGALDVAYKMTGSIDAAGRALTEAAAKTKPFTDVVGGMFSALSGGVSGLVGDILDHTKEAGQIMLDLMGGIGRAFINTLVQMAVQYGATKLTETILGSATREAAVAGYAAEAAAAAYASTAAIPILGPFLAPEAAAAAYAGAMAAGAGAGLAEGGLVRGGVAGKDSVPAMLMPDEYVIPAHQVRSNVRAGRAPDDSGSARGGSGGGGLTVHVHLTHQTLSLPSNVEVDRMLDHSILPGIERAYRTGRLKLRS